jgi:hypothetical protein
MAMVLFGMLLNIKLPSKKQTAAATESATYDY